MKKSLLVLVIAALTALSASCADDRAQVDLTDVSTSATITVTSQAETTRIATPTPTPEKERVYAATMTDKELASIVVGDLSSEHEYYDGVRAIDPNCTDYIIEISIYDEEIDDTFVMHVILPPNYEPENTYPMVVMTDGVWRLNDMVRSRPLIVRKEIEEVIMVCIGYPDGYDFQNIRDRDLVHDPESFLHFITDNLVPYLDGQYPVDMDRLTLVGHSYGGYFAFYALFQSDLIGDRMFGSYIAASPAFEARTGADGIKDFEERFFERDPEPEVRMYVTVGGSESYGTMTLIRDLLFIVENHVYEDLHIKFENIDGESHNSVIGPTLENGLRMFYGI